MLSISQLTAIEKKLKRKQNLSQPGVTAVAVILLIVLVLFTVYPILTMLINVVWDKGIDFEMIKMTFSKKSYWKACGNSLVLAVAAGILATVIGFIFAFLTTRIKVPGKRVFHTLAMLPIISPPFVIALAMILLMGRSGVITRGIFNIRNFNVYGLHSLVFVQVLSMFPLAYLNIKGALESANTAVEDAARSLGAPRGKVILSITLPLCLPSIFSSFLIVLIKSISDFGNPQLLGGSYDTLSAQAYMQINGLNNTRVGSLIAISILIPSVIAFVIQQYWVNRKSFVSVTGKPVRGSDMITENHYVMPFFILCIIFSAIIVLFYGTVVWISFVRLWGVDMSLTLKNYSDVWLRGKEYIKDSLFLSIIATPVSAVLGMIISYMITRKQFLGKKLIRFGSLLTFAVPGIVLGISYILAFNKRPFLLTGTAAILIFVMVFRNISVGIEAGNNSLRQVDISIEEAAVNLGASGYRTFWDIGLPMMKSAFFVALVNTFVRSMTSISAVIFLISVNYNLLTVLIMSEVEGGRYGTAAAYCCILMAIVLAVFALMQMMVNISDRKVRARRKYNE